MDMVGVLVAMAAKVMLVSPPPGILDNTEFMSAVLALENRGERVRTWLLGELALKGLEERLTESCTLKELPEEVRKVPAE